MLGTGVDNEGAFFALRRVTMLGLAALGLAALGLATLGVAALGLALRCIVLIGRICFAEAAAEDFRFS